MLQKLIFFLVIAIPFSTAANACEKDSPEFLRREQMRFVLHQPQSEFVSLRYTGLFANVFRINSSVLFREFKKNIRPHYFTGIANSHFDSGISSVSGPYSSLLTELRFVYPVQPHYFCGERIPDGSVFCRMENYTQTNFGWMLRIRSGGY